MSNGSAKSSLPSGWVQTTVREVFTVVGGGTPSTSVAGYWNGGIPWITSADIGGVREIMPRKTISEDGARHSATNVVPAQAIIVVTRVGLGKVGLTDRPLAFSQDCQGLISDPTLVDPGFAAYQLLERVQAFKYESRGTTIGGVTKKQLLDLPFHLAPYAEQRRIVTGIEEQFSRIDAGGEALKRARLNLQRMRLAVLRDAVAGRLVPQDPAAEPAGLLVKRILEEQPRRRVSPQSTRPGEYGEVPEGWTVLPLGVVAEVQLGRQRSPKNHEGPYMRPYLRAANVTWEGLDLKDVKQMNFPPNDREAYRLQPGDVLLAEASGSASEVGKPALWEGEIEECYLQNTLIRVRSLRPLPTFLRYVFLFEAMSGRFAHAARGVGLHHLGAHTLSAWPLRLPPLEEQARIVKSVEEHFSHLEAIGQTIAMLFLRISTLRRAVLSHALAGRLVPQDPLDEPAAVLMSRIRTARPANNHTPRHRRRSSLR